MQLTEILSSPTLVVKPPSACRPEETDRFVAMVASGGEVQIAGLHRRVQRAYILAFLYLGDELIGIAAIKHPDPHYRDSVFTNAGASEAEHFPFELGWLIVDPLSRGRGYSETLIRAALKGVSGNVFATSAADNAAVHRINQKVGLLPTGHRFTASSGRELILFTKAKIDG